MKHVNILRRFTRYKNINVTCKSKIKISNGKDLHINTEFVAIRLRNMLSSYIYRIILIER